MKEQLEEFLQHVPHLHQMSQKETVAFFAFFLTDVLKDPYIQPKRIRECFDLALIKAPGNISAVMANSRQFVSTRSGVQLRRDIRQQIIDATGIYKSATIAAAVPNPIPHQRILPHRPRLPYQVSPRMSWSSMVAIRS